GTLTNLNYLDLSWNAITNVSWLSIITNLGTLKLAGNALKDVNFLTNLTSLVLLDLSTNRISNAAPLAGLTNPHAVYFEQNRLTSVTPVKNLLELGHADVRLNLIDADADSWIQTNNWVLWDPQREPPFVDVRTNWVVPIGTNSSTLAFQIFDTGPMDQQ